MNDCCNITLYKLTKQWRDDMDRIAIALGYPAGANYGDLLGKIDDIISDAKIAEATISSLESQLNVMRQQYEVRLSECERLDLARQQAEARRDKWRAVAETSPNEWRARAEAAESRANAHEAHIHRLQREISEIGQVLGSSAFSAKSLSVKVLAKMAILRERKLMEEVESMKQNNKNKDTEMDSFNFVPEALKELAERGYQRINNVMKSNNESSPVTNSVVPYVSELEIVEREAKALVHEWRTNPDLDEVEMVSRYIRDAERLGRLRYRPDLDAVNRIAEESVSFEYEGNRIRVVNSADLNACERAVAAAEARGREQALQEVEALLRNIARRRANGTSEET